MKRAAHSKAITERMLARWALPALDGELGKESRGTVLVVGGSREVPGAVMLAAIGALRAGAGRIQIATVRSPRRVVERSRSAPTERCAPSWRSAMRCSSGPE